MKRLRSISVAGLLGLTMLTACGGNDVEAYCEDLRSVQSEFDAMGSGDPSAMLEARESFNDLADVAPEDIAAEWETLRSSMNQVFQALEDAGLDAVALEQMNGGQMPEGVDMERLAELGDSMKELDSAELEQASDTISQHAKDECGVDLG